MIKKVYSGSWIAIILSILLIMPVFYGCKAEEAAIEEIPPVEAAETVEDTGEIEEVKDAEETKPEETIQEEAVPEEEPADEPARIIDISPVEVFEIMENGEDYLIVDVRTREEYDSGHLEGALLLPVQELEESLGELPMDKPIIVYCRSGSRSRSAAEILIANGFTMVYDMGGISSWTAEGYPVVVE